MGRISDTFAELKGHRAAFIAYATAGFPDAPGSLDIMRELLTRADMLEIGIPFSDPTMDGPVIQDTSRLALEAGATVEMALGLAQALRQETAKPVLLMTYYNPVHSYGLADFARAAADVGVDGVLVPDLPLEEIDPWRDEAVGAGLDPVLFASMTSGPERLRATGDLARGFVYALATMGTTGLRDELSEGLASFLAVVQRETGLPVAAGVGISTPEQCGVVGGMADGVIVGSAFMRAALLAACDGADPASAVRDIIVPMATALEGKGNAAAGD